MKFAVLLLGLTTLGSAQSGPAIVQVHGQHRLVLSRSLNAALLKFDPRFEVSMQSEYAPELLRRYPFTRNQAPFAVVGDFNGDGQKDVVVSGHSGTFLTTLCLFAGRFPRVVRFYHSKQAKDPWCCLLLRHPGLLKNDWEPHPLDLKNDGFESVYWGKCSALSYWKDGRFQTYITGD